MSNAKQKQVLAAEAAAYKKQEEAHSEVAEHDAWILRSLCALAKSYIQPANTNINPIVDLLRAMDYRDEAIRKREAARQTWRKVYRKVKAQEARGRR